MTAFLLLLSFVLAFGNPPFSATSPFVGSSPLYERRPISERENGASERKKRKRERQSERARNTAEPLGEPAAASSKMRLEIGKWGQKHNRPGWKVALRSQVDYFPSLDPSEEIERPSSDRCYQPAYEVGPCFPGIRDLAYYTKKTTS